MHSWNISATKETGHEISTKAEGIPYIKPFNKICLESAKVIMNKDTSKPQ